MRPGQTVTMSAAESDRATLMAQVVARTLTQRQAARLLGLSERQVRRLVAAYEAHGPAGLVSRKRGQDKRHWAQCRSDCSFRLDAAEQLKVRATLHQTKQRCELKPKPTCGRAADRCLQALTSPTQLKYYRVKIAKR
jgi:hypothetical protein